MSPIRRGHEKEDRLSHPRGPGRGRCGRRLPDPGPDGDPDLRHVVGQRILGYLGGPGSDVYLAAKDNVENDISLQAIRLRGLGANFYGTDNYAVTSNNRMTAAAADFNLDGLCDLVQGGRATDNNGSGTDTNLSIHISEGAHPLDAQRFKFKDAVYVDYLPTIPGGTYEMNGLGAGDLDSDGDPDIVALDWRGVAWVFWNRFVENGQAPGADPIVDSGPTPVLAWWPPPT